MKKIAFYVEGQTEQFFINRLLTEVAGKKNINIELRKFAGIGKPQIQILLSSQENPRYQALIYDCSGDGSVKPRILEDYEGLFSKGYSKIIGVRDLHPLTIADLGKLEDGLNRFKPLPNDAEIIIAVHEVEAWFLAEIEHYKCIKSNLTLDLIKESLGIDLSTDDVTLLPVPSDTLNDIYQLVGKRYRKKRNQVERTVKCLDYTNIYFVLKNRIEKLGYLIDQIDAFLS